MIFARKGNVRRGPACCGDQPQIAIEYWTQNAGDLSEIPTEVAILSLDEFMRLQDAAKS